MAKAPRTRSPAASASPATAARAAPATLDTGPAAAAIMDGDHPDYIGGIYSDYCEEERQLTPVPGGPAPFPGPQPRPLPGPFPLPIHPGIPDLPVGPIGPIRFCGPVSGRYRFAPPVLAPTVSAAGPGPLGVSPVFTRTTFIVRVDVDRYYPQNRISIEASRFFPAQRAHAIAEVTRDLCSALYRRRVEANITFREGVAALIPGVRVIFEATRASRPFGYGSYQLTLVEANGATRTYPLEFRSQYFDEVEFEVDCVSNATPVVTSYNTGSHPNRPATLPAEVIDLGVTFARAGFGVTMSPSANVIPTSGAGSNGTWSDAEMHNAMVAHWSRFSNAPRWAMWVLFAARHDMGSGLGGIMFDDIGPNHRQGTAIFTNSFIVDAPAGDPNPGAWRNRSVYWTTVHEMGHAFNLAHSWQKALGAPWVPLANEDQARSFMNYPTRVTGGQQSFFSDFAFRFSNSELMFMRHAPRRFVQMGNENWFENHGFEKLPEMDMLGVALHLRPNRETNSFDFMEPVKLELKLENRSQENLVVDDDIIADGRHVALLVRRDGGETRRWRPFATYFDVPQDRVLKPGESIYASHFVAATGDGWLIDEPGFYSIQAAIELGGVVVVSNPLRVFVGPPDSKAEEGLAPDYFTEDVARVLAFNGAPELTAANDVLEEVVAKAPDSPAAIHATVALNDPLQRDFKVLETSAAGDTAIRAQSAKVAVAASREIPALVGNADAAARTMGHIDYRDTVEALTDALVGAGDTRKAIVVQKSLVDTLAKRKVLPAVVAASQRKLERVSA